MPPRQRNTSISIVKAIAITLMVMGHAEGPWWLNNFIYIFHMPVFFVTAGYFWSTRSLQEPWTFCRKRFKGLYVPFLKWSVFFLLIHNLMFKVGILNEQYGNWEGGVTHPYSLTTAVQRLVNMVFTMGGYDEFLAGAFWFFRGLLVTSLAFFVAYKLLNKYRRPLRLNDTTIPLVIIGFALGLLALKACMGIKFNNINQGGARELFGTIFFAGGVLYRRWEHKIPKHPLLTLLCLGILVGAVLLHCHGMNIRTEPRDVLTLPLTGMAGFVMLHHIATWLDGRLSGTPHRWLTYCGDNTLHIFIFHISAFKLVTALKIWYYGLDWGQMGTHMVVHYRSDSDLFILLYTLVGTALPLLWLHTYRRLRHKKIATPQA